MSEHGSVLPPAPAPPSQVWTPSFRWRFAALVVAGALAFLLAIRNVPLLLAEWQGAVFISMAVLVTCLGGAFLVSSRWVRVGLFVQAGSVLCWLLSTVPWVWGLWVNMSVDLVRLTFHLSLAADLLSVVSFLCFSYGLIHWRTAADGWLTGLQVALSGLGFAWVWIQNRVPPLDSFLAVSLAEKVASAACGFFVLALLLLRPAFWRRFPLVTALLAVRGIVGAYYALPPQLLGPTWYDDSTLTSITIEAGIRLGADLPFLLGMVLLVQTVRAQKREQDHLSAPK